MSWKDGEFLFGQFWHPLFIVNIMMLSFNIGAPMEAQARDPQLRLSQKFGRF